MQTGDSNKKIIAIYNKIIWLFNIYWGIYNIFIDSVDLQYTKSFSSERISQKNSLFVLKKNSLIKRKLFDYALSSSVRKISRWQSFALTEPTIKVITFFNQYLVYFLKEDFGYSLLYIMGGNKLKKIIDDNDKDKDIDENHKVLTDVIRKVEKSSFTGNTTKLHLLQPEDISLKQIKLEYYFSEHQTVQSPTQEYHKPSGGTYVQQKIQKELLDSLIKSFSKNNDNDTEELNKKILIKFLKSRSISGNLNEIAEKLLNKSTDLKSLRKSNKKSVVDEIILKLNKNEEISEVIETLKASSKKQDSLNKYGYIMSIFTNIISAKILNPEIMCCDDDISGNNNFNFFKIVETKNNGNGEIDEVDDKQRLKKNSEILAILDNGFIVLMEKVFEPSQYVIVGIVAQMVKSPTVAKSKPDDYNAKEEIADTEFILYKPYVPFDLKENDIKKDKNGKKDHELYNTKICTYRSQTNKGNVKIREIKFQTFLPYDFELANLLVRVLINFGIRIGSKQFGPNFKETPSIIMISNNVIKQSLIDIFR